MKDEVKAKLAAASGGSALSREIYECSAAS
jgi:hypothetical protein